MKILKDIVAISTLSIGDTFVSSVMFCDREYSKLTKVNRKGKYQISVHCALTGKFIYKYSVLANHTVKLVTL